MEIKKRTELIGLSTDIINNDEDIINVYNKIKNKLNINY
jgi:hypothetical protein